MTTKPEFQIQSCGVLVFRYESALEFLLMRHADRWDLPKGHVDPGESERDCALRELYEETGISSHQIELDPNFVNHQEYWVRPRHGGGKVLKRLTVFMGLLKAPCAITVSEHVGSQWFEWRPPHHIQTQSIDPLLKAIEEYWRSGAPKW